MGRKTNDELRADLLRTGGANSWMLFFFVKSECFGLFAMAGVVAHFFLKVIACMGIEKIIPKEEHLGVFLRLLARSATGQPITTFSSHFNTPAPGKEMHIVIVDNGRTKQLSREDFRSSLSCIRCGACMNTCPIYRRSGGYSYNATIPGPIGSILSPGMDMKKHSSLPFASTLCGSCSNVCPVKINIHEQLYKWRQIITKEQKQPFVKKTILKIMGGVLARPKIYAVFGKSVRFMLKHAPRFMVYSELNTWGKSRELPKVENGNFDQWYKKRESNE
jgi:L-lactate dehydrogenase complex protein LldF